MRAFRNPQQRDETAHDAAITWRVRRQIKPLDDTGLAAFTAWLDASPDHRAAYDEIDELWQTAGELGQHPLYVETRERAIAAADRLRTTRRSVAAGLAAAVVGLASGALYIENLPKPLAAQTFHTAIGQRAAVTLPDGSRVTLNTDTVLRTKSADGKRLVYLDRGQAFFEVAKDRRHPFIVTAAGRTVTAVGTAFDVRIDHGELKVVLVEGKVRVAPAHPLQPSPKAQPAAKASPPMVTDMSAGSQLVVVNDTDWRLTPTNTARDTSWLNGQLVFDDETLADIAEEMNRYSTRKLVVADKQLAGHRISGNFKPGDVDGFARMLRTGGVASLIENPDGEIEIVAMK
jgi:transmembrane sensor